MIYIFLWNISKKSKKQKPKIKHLTENNDWLVFAFNIIYNLKLENSLYYPCIKNTTSYIVNVNSNNYVMNKSSGKNNSSTCMYKLFLRSISKIVKHKRINNKSLLKEQNEKGFWSKLHINKAMRINKIRHKPADKRKVRQNND